jgi:hypothetical protein
LSRRQPRRDRSVRRGSRPGGRATSVGYAGRVRTRSPVRYDHTPYLFPVGTRVRAKKDLPGPDGPERAVVAIGTLGTVVLHNDAHCFVCRFDGDPGRLAVAPDFALADVAVHPLRGGPSNVTRLPPSCPS